MDLLTRRYRTAKSIAGPLIFIEKAQHVSIGEMVRIIVSEQDVRSGQVIEVSDKYAVIQVLEETTGIGLQDTDICFTGSVAKVDLSFYWGLSTLNDGEQWDLLEILEDRNGMHSTMIASQIPVENWHEVIANSTLADAIMDRLIHSAYKINLKGESMRKKKSKLT